MTMRVLVADSDPSLCEIFHQFFSVQGCDVATATDGLECLAKLRDFTPDILVLEWEIPWGGGDGVLAQLRDEYPLLCVDVVLVATDGLDTNLPYDEPVVECLTKPFHMAKLLEVVRPQKQGDRRWLKTKHFATH